MNLVGLLSTFRSHQKSQGHDILATRHRHCHTDIHSTYLPIMDRPSQSFSQNNILSVSVLEQSSHLGIIKRFLSPLASWLNYSYEPPELFGHQDRISLSVFLTTQVIQTHTYFLCLPWTTQVCSQFSKPPNFGSSRHMGLVGT